MATDARVRVLTFRPRFTPRFKTREEMLAHYVELYREWQHRNYLAAGGVDFSLEPIDEEDFERVMRPQACKG